MIACHQISQEAQSLALYESLGDLILVVVTRLRVVARVMLTPHVVVAIPHVVAVFVVFRGQVAEDLLTSVGFLVPRTQTFPLDIEARRKRIGILGH